MYYEKKVSNVREHTKGISFVLVLFTKKLREIDSSKRVGFSWISIFFLNNKHLSASLYIFLFVQLSRLPSIIVRVYKSSWGKKHCKNTRKALSWLLFETWSSEHTQKLAQQVTERKNYNSLDNRTQTSAICVSDKNSLSRYEWKPAKASFLFLSSKEVSEEWTKPDKIESLLHNIRKQSEFNRWRIRHRSLTLKKNLLSKGLLDFCIRNLHAIDLSIKNIGIVYSDKRNIFCRWLTQFRAFSREKRQKIFRVKNTLRIKKI